MSVFAEPILNILFPMQANGTALLQICSISILFILLNQTISGALQGLGKPIVSTIGLSVGVIVKLVLNILLIPIPEIGINGAGIASVISHIVSFLIEFTALRKLIKVDTNLGKYIIKPVLATIIMIISSYYIYINLEKNISQGISFFITIIFATIIYIFLIIFLKIFNKSVVKIFPLRKQRKKVFTSLI